MKFTFIPEQRYLWPHYTVNTYQHPSGKRPPLMVVSGYSWCGKYERFQWVVDRQGPTAEDQHAAAQQIEALRAVDKQYIVEAAPNYVFCNLAGCQAAVDKAWEMNCYLELSAQLYCCLSPGEARHALISGDGALLRYERIRNCKGVREIAIPPNMQACLKCRQERRREGLTSREDSMVFREIWSQTGVVYYLSASGSALETALYVGQRWHAPMLFAYPRVPREAAEMFYRMVPSQLRERVNGAGLALPPWCGVEKSASQGGC